MKATATASTGSGPRYAPEDPTLPKPWRGLVDGSTGYLYYWNPDTNVTQYERPATEELPPPPPLPPKLAPFSSVQVHQHRHDDDGRSRTQQHQVVRVTSGRSGHGSIDVGHGSSGTQNQSQVALHSRPSARIHGHLEVNGLSIEAYRRQHEITVIGDDVPAPFLTFESTGFPLEILKEVHHAGFSSPTPIQAQSWPIALQSRDVVAIAKTGSGKTLGYLFPGFIHLKSLHNNPKVGPTVLVLSPTRELATQIQDEAEKFGRSSRISCTCLYGGAPKGPQLRDLDRGVDVVVATPGRLNDILEMRRISLRQVSYLVLDEADRMLDMGFEPQIRKIVKEVPHHRQTLMFTATWPKEVRKIAADLLVNPIHVNIGNIDELVANKAITQFVEVIKPLEKQRRLEQILRSQEAGSKIIIFCSTKRMCDQLARSLSRQFGAQAIHGDKSQGERDRVLSQFKTGRSPILVATDVAARGLDIKDIRVVINYDFPTGVEDYVHRIGRTGRAGATGVSYTFFSEQDSKYALDLVKVLEGADQRVPLELRDMVSRGGYGGKSRRWASGSNTRDRGRLGGLGDAGNGGRSGHGQTFSSRLDSNRSAYGRERDARDRHDRGRTDARDSARHGTSEAKGTLRGSGRSRSRSFSRSPRRGHGGTRYGPSHSPSPSPKRGFEGIHDGRSRSRSRSRSHSRSWDNARSRSRSRSRSLGRSNGRLGMAEHSGRTLLPSKRKETSIDGPRVAQSPPPKRRETSMDHHRGLLPLPKRDSSVDHHHGPSPPHQIEPSIDHDRKPSPSFIRQTSVDNCSRTSSLPKLESSTDLVPVIDAHVLPMRDRSLSPPRPRCASPCRHAENGSGELASPGTSRQSPPQHYLDEVERDKPRLPTEEVGIECCRPQNEPVTSSPATYHRDDEEGLISPEEEGVIPPEPDSALPPAHYPETMG